MEIIKSRDELWENIGTFRSYLNYDNVKYKKFALGMIEHEHCFVVVKRNDKLEFFPSCFVGYKNNEYTTKPEDKTNTNEHSKAIANVVRIVPLDNTDLDEELLRYGTKIGIRLKDVPHRFWKMYSDCKVF